LVLSTVFLRECLQSLCQVSSLASNLLELYLPFDPVGIERKYQGRH
jgi:hypothetical protein